MSPKHFDLELDQLETTFTVAQSADVSGLASAIAAASQQSIITIGSGGSFTVASLFASLHEAYTGRVSRAVTPLELICNPNIASTSPIFIVSAEGKNPDVLEAVTRARRRSSRTIHILTNRDPSPLTQKADELSDVATHLFRLEAKDGYLATNSLLLDCMLVARAYGLLDQRDISLPPGVHDFRVSGAPFSKVQTDMREFGRQVAATRALIVVYSPQLSPVAIDLESKLSESALAFCQMADFRSFAHGRHLWLTDRPKDCALLVISEPSTRALWDDMRPVVPTNLATHHLSLDGSKPGDLIAGLVAQMHLVAGLAERLEIDIAKPVVSALGRQLHYADLKSLVPPEGDDSNERGEISKYEAFGTYWPTVRASGNVRRSALSFEEELVGKPFKAIIFDYDGTLSSSTRLNTPPSADILQRLTDLLRGGLRIGIASGRGGSIQEYLRAALPEELWSQVYLGLYNGGWTATLGAEIPQPQETPELLLHCQRLISELGKIGVPVERLRLNSPYQLSIRFRAGTSTESMWYVVCDVLRQSGLSNMSIVRSKHSVDILAKGVSKANLISEISKSAGIDPYDILTMGDMGAWPGNDYSLLEHRYSLSVDLPSRRLDRGWKLAPHHMRDVDATRWYLSRLHQKRPGSYSFDFNIEHAHEG